MHTVFQKLQTEMNKLKLMQYRLGITVMGSFLLTARNLLNAYFIQSTWVLKIGEFIAWIHFSSFFELIITLLCWLYIWYEVLTLQGEMSITVYCKILNPAWMIICHLIWTVIVLVTPLSGCSSRNLWSIILSLCLQSDLLFLPES